ncbi:MAG TPA: RsmD family RNA methyltransferase [Candidatus Acidoferrales bacterium]
MTSPFETKIEKLVYGGDGLAHHEQSTVFVPFVIPGEVVRVTPVEARKKFIRGTAEQIVEPSSERIAAQCPRFTVCGGCHYQQIPYEAQLRYKSGILRETLARIGRIEWTGEIHTHASPPFGYRNRAQWAVRPAGTPPKPAIGYFQQSSSVLVPTDVCPILASKLESTLAALSAAFAEGRLPGNITGIECFSDASGEKVLLNVSLAQTGQTVSTLAARFREIVSNVESILFHDEKTDDYQLLGPGYLHYEAAGHSFRVGHLSFFQVNRFVVDDLVRAVVGDAAEGENKRGLALDLFAGVGLFSIPLAARYDRVIAVEGNVATARDLEANLKNHATARGRHVDSESFLARHKEPADFVVLDPPRAGLTPPAIQRLRDLGPSNITYLSCDPATLARDLAAFTGSAAPGSPYEISNITLYDIFPQTYHIEALVKLQRIG